MWCVFVSVIVLARVGYPLRTGVDGPFLVLCLFCVTFLVHMRCGSCTGGKSCFACGVNVFIVTNLNIMLYITNSVWLCSEFREYMPQGYIKNGLHVSIVFNHSKSECLLMQQLYLEPLKCQDDN